MSILKKLFGGGDDKPTAGPSIEAVEHEGFLITPTPMPEGSQFRLSGTISREVDGEMKEHRLIRADVFSSVDECVEFTVRKGKQVIDEQGDRLFGAG